MKSLGFLDPDPPPVRLDSGSEEVDSVGIPISIRNLLEMLERNESGFENFPDFDRTEMFKYSLSFILSQFSRTEMF